MPYNSGRLTINHRKQWISFKTCHCNALDSPNCFVSSTMPRRIYSEDYLCSKYDLYGQPYHGGFTVKITDSPNMVCTVNHATEDLQHRILDYSKYCLLHCQVHANGKRGKTQTAEGTVQSEKRNRRATGIQVGKTKMTAEFQTPPTHSSSRVYTFYTCAYYCFPITGHVTVFYNSQKIRHFRRSIANCSGSPPDV